MKDFHGYLRYLSGGQWLNSHVLFILYTLCGAYWVPGPARRHTLPQSSVPSRQLSAECGVRP